MGVQAFESDVGLQARFGRESESTADCHGTPRQHGTSCQIICCTINYFMQF